MIVSKKQFKTLVQLLHCIAQDCAEHLKDQHEQGVNDKPRFYFDNIAKQTLDLLKEL